MTSFPLISGVFAPSFTHSAGSSARDGNPQYLLLRSKVASVQDTLAACENL